MSDFLAAVSGEMVSAHVFTLLKRGSKPTDAIADVHAFTARVLRAAELIR